MTALTGIVAEGFALIIVVATVLGFVAQRTRQPTLIAYILTGIVLGPIVLDAVTETALIGLMSELGLGFLLFLIGVEMKFDEIRGIFGPVVRIALGQTVLQTGLAFAVSYLLGFSFIETVILAMATVFGATPVVVKLLADKDEISTLPGKLDVGVLLIQDVILIISLTVLSAGSLSNPVQIAVSLTEVLGLVAVIAVFSFASSRYLLPTLFEKIVENKHAFFIYGIAWAFLFITLSQMMDISLEVGAFLAGLSLGQLPYSSEMQERIRPITDFFMVIFFASIGLSLSAENLLMYWKEAVIASIILMVGNFLIMFYLIDREQFTPETSFKGSINMIQVSEFSLVVGAMAITQGFIGEDILGYLSLMALMTMGASSYVINYNHEIYERLTPVLEWWESEEKQDIDIETLNEHAVILGYNEMAEDILPVLEEHFDQILVVDRHPRNVRTLSGRDHEFIYGDFKHGEIRKASKIKTASFIVSFVADHSINLRILEDRRDDALVFLRSEGVDEAAELYELGADYVINKKILAASKLIDYLETYFEDDYRFTERIREDTETIWWRDHRG